MQRNNPDELLIVEDEPSIRALYKVLIARHFPDIKVESVGDGADAVDRFSKGHPATILMDSKLPVLDGITACMHLQKICSLKHWELPQVIICTAAITARDRHLISRLKPRPSVLAKPVRNSELIDEVRSALYPSRAR